MRIDVAGQRARLTVGRAAQPCLVVNDLKLPASRGAVALWVGSDTVAYFADLRLHPAVSDSAVPTGSTR